MVYLGIVLLVDWVSDTVKLHSDTELLKGAQFLAFRASTHAVQIVHAIMQLQLTKFLQ